MNKLFPALLWAQLTITVKHEKERVLKDIIDIYGHEDDLEIINAKKK